MSSIFGSFLHFVQNSINFRFIDLNIQYSHRSSFRNEISTIFLSFFFFLQKQQAFNVSHLSFLAILKRKFHLPRAKRMKIFFLFNFRQIYTYRQQIFRIEISLVETLNSNRIVLFAYGKNIDS